MRFQFAPELGVESARRRRARLIVVIGCVLLIANGAGWGAFFAWRGDALLVAADLLQIALGGLGLLLNRLGHERLSHYLLVLAATILVVGLTYWIDIPDAEAGRSLHYWLLPIAGIAVILLQGEPKWLSLGLPGAMLLLFALTDTASFAAAGPSPLAASVRIPGEWINKLGALASALLVLHVFVRDADRIEADLERANAKIHGLLNMVFPRRIAQRLIAGEPSFAERHAECSVLFADIVGFTSLVESRPQGETIAMLSGLFDSFDALVEQRGVTKIKTIGDAYMVVAGVPEAQSDHAMRLVELAREMLAATAAHPGLALRIGIHSGELTAGVIGRVRQTYDVWGDTVNIAARLEAHGEPGRIQISASTRAQLPAQLEVESRGAIELRGKRERIQAYLL